MAYIGKEPIVGNFQKCDAITVVNGQAAYTLQVSSTNVVPESANHMLVSLNGILQAPVTSFTVSGSTLTFASNLATGDVIDFVILLGNVLDLGTPSDGTVTNAKLASDVISGETDIGGAIADSDLFLLDDGAGGTLRKTAASRIKTYVGSGLAEADQWRLTTTFTGDASPIASNWERVDSAVRLQAHMGTGMSESSGVFTFPSTGFWLVTFDANFSINGDDRAVYAMIRATTDNGSAWNETGYSSAFIQQTSSNWTGSSASTQAIVDVADTSNDKVAFRIDASNSSTQTEGDTNQTTTGVTFIRLGDT